MSDIPSPGEGYRWLEPCVDRLQEGDEVNHYAHSNTFNKSTVFGLIVSPGDRYRFRRRIEPASEPKKWVDVVPEAGMYFSCFVKSGIVSNYPSYYEKKYAFEGYKFLRVHITKPTPPVEKFEPIVVERDHENPIVVHADAYEIWLVKGSGPEKGHGIFSMSPAASVNLRAALEKAEKFACDKAAEYVRRQGK